MKGNKDIERMAMKRMKVCLKCPIYTKGFCSKEKGGCGCLLKAKTRSVKAKCPIGLW